MQRYKTRQVLLGATVAFALVTSILLICDGKSPSMMTMISTTHCNINSGHWWAATAMGQLQPRGNIPVSC